MDFRQQVENTLGLHIHGQVSSFAKLIEEVLIFAKRQKVTIVIDEFQRLEDIGEGIISELQDVWDKHHAECHVHLIAIERLDHKATIAEVRRNAQKHNPQVLEDKAQRIKSFLRGYDVTLCGLSMDDM